MKNHKNKLPLLFAAILAIASCKKDIQVTDNVMLTDDDAGKKLTIASGQKCTLSLNNPGDGGYNLDKPQLDSTIIHLEKYEHIAPANGLTGDAGKDNWQFTPVRIGITILKITATRPWNNGGTVTMFTDTIVVK
jgi:predicted secreted protein